MTIKLITTTTCRTCGYEHDAPGDADLILSCACCGSTAIDIEASLAPIEGEPV